jgi:hypothetical protein
LSLRVDWTIRDGRPWGRADEGVSGPSAVQHIFDIFGDVEPSLSMLWGNLSYEVSERSPRLFADEIRLTFRDAQRSA